MGGLGTDEEHQKGGARSDGKADPEGGFHRQKKGMEGGREVTEGR